MYFCFMIVLTGAAGFIGSCLLRKLNHLSFDDIVIVDDFSNIHKKNNLEGKNFFKKIDRSVFLEWFLKNTLRVNFVFHIGARTDTIQQDKDVFRILNLEYSKALWNICSEKDIPFVYASSAATYGMGEFGFMDDHKIITRLKPLNEYAFSKHNFDTWVLSQRKKPSFWLGFKFFNVYGPNEYHKRRMASVILHAFNQIQESKSMKLFKSHNPEYKDGDQARDFIYVKDVVNVLSFSMNLQLSNGIYNLGSGVACTFNHLASTIFNALRMDLDISFIDTPEQIRKRYQYFTKANMSKLRSGGYVDDFTPLKQGVEEYVQTYLLSNSYY